MWQTTASTDRAESSGIGMVWTQDRAATSGRDVGLAATAASGAVISRKNRLCHTSAGIDRSPGRGVSHQGRKHCVVELVAAARGPVRPEQRQARQRQIADRIKRLVAHEFICETQAFRIEDAII